MNSNNNNPSTSSRGTPNCLLKSIECRTPVKIMLHNQSNRKVNITWLDYKGSEVIYFTLGPKCKYVIDSFVTHPWIFRDFKRKNLAIFDALVADRRDLFLLHTLNKYSERKRFQVASRILFPIQHNHPHEFLLVIIKNGVHSLQEICLNTLIETIKTPGNEQRLLNILWQLPKHIRENFKSYLEQGQSSLEFLDF